MYRWMTEPLLPPMQFTHRHTSLQEDVVSSGGAPTPASKSVFTKHNWDMGANAESVSGPDASSILPQGLDRKVSDIHLAEIATALINWREVCTNLGIKQADEVAIEEENKTANARRFVVVLLQNAGNSVYETCMFQGISCMIHAQVYHCMHGTPHP